MIRRIIQIDEEKCTGCGLCAAACHEGAIDMVNGKAKLAREHYCDGLGDCLPACPADAIHFVEREAPAYDEEAVRRAAERRVPATAGKVEESKAAHTMPLKNWPIQVKLTPVVSPAFAGADLLIAADCTGYAYGSFHREFAAGRTLLIACPKLDMVDYSEKLAQIFAMNEIRSITLIRMEVPCCGGLENAVLRAIAASGKQIPCEIITIGIQGELLARKKI